jgi:hypothetical protein
MRKVILSAATAALCAALYLMLCLPTRLVQAQDKPAAAQEKDVNPEEIIRKFAAKEAEFRDARNNYTYRQTVKMEELEPVGGKWEEIDDIIFTPQGKRSEVVIWAPVISLKNITLTPEDTQDLRDVQPFVLTSTDISNYNVNYLGREKLDDIGCFTFSVKPKKLEKGKRYFEGEIWVDDRDLQIVKTYGKGVGIVKKGNEFPKFETYREQIDGKYWFPTYTHADDTLHFPDGQNQHIRMTVKYQDYKKFEGKSTITYGKTVDDQKSTTPSPTKKK